MPYEKKFNKDKTEVIITATGDSIGLWDSEERGRMKEKKFEVVKKEKIYECISKKEPIDLKDKYIKAFSLKKYRYDMGLSDNDKVYLKDFDAERAFFDGGADFSNVVFEGEGEISFGHAIFGDGDILFERVIFGEGKVSFIGVTFGEGEVSFFLADFGDGGVFFWGVNFGKGDVSFAYAKFGEGEASFWNVKFGEGFVFFANADFGKGSIFFANADFGEGEASFWNVKFGEGDVDFSSLKVKGDWYMRKVKADTINFSDSLIHGTINLARAKINQLKLIDTQLTGKIFISSNELKLKDSLNSQDDVINSQDTTHKEKRDQFRLLKENFRNLGLYDDEDKTYVQFMKHKIRNEAGFGFAPFWKKVLRFPVFLFKWLFFEIMGLYGTSPTRVALSMAVVLGLFSGVYYKYSDLLLKASETVPVLTKTNKALYHSAITFLTIGYGDYYPHGILRFLSGIEGFAGLFLMSYFTISFVRKVLR